MATDIGSTEDLIELEAYMLNQLAGGVKSDQVVFTVAQRQQWHWSRAEAFVNGIATRQHETIQNRQKPLFRVMSVLLIVAGFVIVFVTLSTMMIYVDHLMRQRMSDLEFLAFLASAIAVAVGRDLMQLVSGLTLLLAGVVGWIKTLPPRTSPALDYGVDADDVSVDYDSGS